MKKIDKNPFSNKAILRFFFFYKWFCGMTFTELRNARVESGVQKGNDGFSFYRLSFSCLWSIQVELSSK